MLIEVSRKEELMHLQKYQRLSAIYDEQWGEWHKQYYPYLSKILETRCPPVSRILDLGCATGAMVEHLCSLGHAAEGMDSSEEMIEIAKRKNIAGSPFRVHNMCRFSSEQKYDLITCTFYTLNYLQENDQLDDLFFSVSMSLEMGGLFLFDSYTEHFLKKHHHGTIQRSYKDGSLTEERSYDDKTKIALTHFRFPDDMVETHRQHPYTLTDLLGSIMNAGLYVLYSHSGFKQEPYYSASEQLICLAAKPKLD